MSHAHSLYTLYEIARVTLPTFVESLAGRPIDSDTADARLASFARRVIARTGIRLEVHGRELVPADRALVYMSNHQSHLDIPVLYATVPAKSLRMIGKKELFRVPVWGRAMRAAGFVEIDRGDRAKAIASLDRAGDILRAGTSIWIAPEGHRSKTGRLGPLKKGGFHLARDTGTPILPVAIEGTVEILAPGTTSITPNRPVRVVFGKPVDVQDRSVDDLVAEIRAFLQANNGKG